MYAGMPSFRTGSVRAFFLSGRKTAVATDLRLFKGCRRGGKDTRAWNAGPRLEAKKLHFLFAAGSSNDMDRKSKEVNRTRSIFEGWSLNV